MSSIGFCTFDFCENILPAFDALDGIDLLDLEDFTKLEVLENPDFCDLGPLPPASTSFNSLMFFLLRAAALDLPSNCSSYVYGVG